MIKCNAVEIGRGKDAQRAARRFSPDALERAVLRCAETDYAMKHSGRDNVALLEEFMLSLMEDMR